MDEKELMRAFIEGDDKPDRVNQHRTETLMKGLTTSFSFSEVSLFLGPVYWGYRKCLGASIPIVVLFTAVVAFCMWNRIWLPFSYFFYLVPASLFYTAYRARGRRIAKEALEKFDTEEEIFAYVRKKGGTSYPRAFLPLMLFLALVALLAFLLS